MNLNLTEEEVFILYKSVLVVVEPENSIRQISRLAMKANGKPYTAGHIYFLLEKFEKLGLIKKKINRPRCIRYERTPKGNKLAKTESLR